VKQCSWCGSSFKPNVSYQVYCGANCREESTKEKIHSRYSVVKRKKRKLSPKKCAGGCGITLSVYNDDKVCNACKINKDEVAKTLKQIKGIIRDIKNNKH
jgi:hypothetical protein